MHEDLIRTILPCVVALDETDGYTIKEEDQPYIDKIVGIYLYDKNQHTYLCEMVPSYFLRHIENQVRFTEAGEALEDYLQDRIYQAYEYEPSEDIYVHVSTIDRIEEKAKPEDYRHRVLEEEPFRGMSEREEDNTEEALNRPTYEEAMEGLMEFVRCNGQL